MQKKGISNVIVVVLLILLAIVVIIIFWYVYKYMINKDTDVGLVTSSFEIVKAKEVTAYGYEVNVRRNVGYGNVVKLKLVFENQSGDRYVYDYNYSIEELEMKIIQTGTIPLINPIKVEVYPVILSEKGNELLGPRKDVYEFEAENGNGCVSLGLVGNITTVTVESANDVGKWSSIALDSNGVAHISEYDVTNTGLRYCNNTGGSWNCVAVDTANNVGQYSSIAIDSNNVVHISEYDATNWKLRYCNNTGGTWSCDTDASSWPDSGFYSSIAIDSNNVAHISSYIDGPIDDLFYCNNTAGTWSCDIIDSMTGPFTFVGQYSSIALDSNNVVHISEYQGTNGYLRYCNNTAGTWSCVNVDTTNVVGQYSSIAIDSNNVAHISEYDVTNGNLRYCNNTGGTWSCDTVDTDNDVGSYSSIAIDSNNIVHISHWDDTSDALRYCNNTGGTWNCEQLDNTGTAFGTPNGRWLAIKKGRIVDTTSFDTTAHMSWYNSTSGDLMYTTYQFGLAASTC